VKLLRTLSFFLAAFTATTVLAQSSSGVGTVNGRVLTEDGHPVPGASVYLVPLHRAGVGRPDTVKTNEMGIYKISVKEPGPYAIHAFKIEEGYPDVIFAFDVAPNQALRREKVNILEGQSLTGIDVKLGPRSGNLHFQVVDERTGRPLTKADYKLCQVQVPDNCVNSRAVGAFDISVPATEISVEISSPGYSTVKYAEKNQPFILVKPGEERDLVIKLALR